MSDQPLATGDGLQVGAVEREVSLEPGESSGILAGKSNGSEQSDDVALGSKVILSQGRHQLKKRAGVDPFPLPPSSSVKVHKLTPEDSRGSDQGVHLSKLSHLGHREVDSSDSHVGSVSQCCFMQNLDGLRARSRSFQTTGFKKPFNN